MEDHGPDRIELAAINLLAGLGYVRRSLSGLYKKAVRLLDTEVEVGGTLAGGDAYLGLRRADPVGVRSEGRAARDLHVIADLRARRKLPRR